MDKFDTLAEAFADNYTNGYVLCDLVTIYPLPFSGFVAKLNIGIEVAWIGDGTIIIKTHNRRFKVTKNDTIEDDEYIYSLHYIKSRFMFDEWVVYENNALNVAGIFSRSKKQTTLQLDKNTKLDCATLKFIHLNK